MTAGDREAAAAREAVAQAQNLAQGYLVATGGEPGVGALLPLPDQVGVSGHGVGPQHGDGYTAPPESTPAAQTPPGRPTYAGEPAGGGGFQDQLTGEGAQWPLPTPPKFSASRSVAYVSPRSTPAPAEPVRARTVRSRIRSARRAVLGR